MTQKIVFIAGFIGLVFGFLFSATLGVDFFPSEEPNNDITDETDTESSGLEKDAEGFKTAYNLTESIYLPITGTQAYAKIEADDTFILYAGRDTCPYCQQFVPVLMQAAENLDIDMIYHVDTTDTLNRTFVDNENARITPTTFIYVDGTLVETIVGYNNLTDTQQLLSDALS